MFQRSCSWNPTYWVMYHGSLCSRNFEKRDLKCALVWNGHLHSILKLRKNRREDRYLDSKVSGCTTNQHLLDYIQEGLKVFDLSKMIQLSMDGPHMNLKLLWKMKEQRNKLEYAEFIDIGTCNLYVVGHAFKSGAEVTSRNFKSKLKSYFKLLKDSPAPRDDFITESTKSLLPFCAGSF